MADQLTFELPEIETHPPKPRPRANRIEAQQRTAPDNSGKWYQCFTINQDEETAAAIFESRFGYPPDEIYEDSGLLWLGPVK